LRILHRGSTQRPPVMLTCWVLNVVCTRVGFWQTHLISVRTRQLTDWIDSERVVSCRRSNTNKGRRKGTNYSEKKGASKSHRTQWRWQHLGSSTHPKESGIRNSTSTQTNGSDLLPPRGVPAPAGAARGEDPKNKRGGFPQRRLYLVKVRGKAGRRIKKRQRLISWGVKGGRAPSRAPRASGSLGTR